MSLAWSVDGTSVSLAFASLPWKVRVLRYLRSLLGWKRAPLLLFLFALPNGLFWFIDDEAESGILLSVGVPFGLAMVGFVVGLGILSALLTRVPPRTITFSPNNIVENVGGVRFDRGWQWVTGAKDDGVVLELKVQEPPMRTGRIQQAGLGFLLLDRRVVGPEVFLVLVALLKSRDLYPR